MGKQTENIKNKDWIEVSNFPSYEIHKNKGIRRKGKERGLKGRNWLGYPKVTLMRDGVKHEKRIHKLVGEHFVPNPKKLPIVNHKDSDRSNHTHSNLEWVDNSGNQLHRWKTQKEGMMKKKYLREYGPMAELDKMASAVSGSMTKVQKIRHYKKLKAKGMSPLDISRMGRESEYKAAGMGPARRAINHALPFNKVIG